MQALTSCFTAIFTALTTFFSATEKIAKTMDNLATVAEESSGAYMDESRNDRQIKALNSAKRLKEAQAANE